MPAVSEKQRRLMAMAEHNPGAIYPENKAVTKMSSKQLHDFSSTKGPLPETKAKHTVKHSLGRQQHPRGGKGR